MLSESNATRSENLFLECIDTPTGRMLMVTLDDGRLCALDWEDHEDRMRQLLRRYNGGGFRLCERSRVSNAARALQAYFEGDFAAIAGLPTAARGTDFQCEVWEALRSIPIGTTTSYGALAAQIGRPKAMRAVGLANGANPISIVVPCHRVIGADSSLTGYGGGLERKRWLLAHESRAALQPPTNATILGKSKSLTRNEMTRDARMK